MRARTKRPVTFSDAAGPAGRSRAGLQKTHSRGASLRSLLLGGTALCGVAVVGADEARAANILPTQGAVNLATAGAGSVATKVLNAGAVTAGTAGYTSTGATAAINLSATRTLIDWSTYEVGTGNTLTYNFANGPSDIVINRVVGGTINVDAGGTVQGMYNGSTGGNIWFLAPNGVFINGTVTASGV